MKGADRASACVSNRRPRTTSAFSEAKKLYNDFNKATDIGRVAEKLKNDALRSTDVSEANIGGYTSGDLNVVGGLRGKANEAYTPVS